MIITLKEINKLKFEERITLSNWFNIQQNKYFFYQISLLITITFFFIIMFLSDSFLLSFYSFIAGIFLCLLMIKEIKNWRRIRKEIIESYFEISPKSRRKK